MNNYSAYINNDQNVQYHPSCRPPSQSQSLTQYSSTPPLPVYQAPQNTMSQSAYAYYQQQQGYAHAAPAQPNTAAQMPSSYAYQGFAAHPGHPSLPPTSTTAHHQQQGFPAAQQQIYSGYNTNATYAQPSPQLYPQYLEQGQGVPATYDYQRRGSSSTVSSSPSQSSQSSSSSDRFPCPNCDKSFTRNFDRKRHMEIHMPGSAGNNRCRYCHKDYSRPDSLKRHLDNGCEKKPHS
ncbi:hypothetical protein ACEPAF_7838 [Sanghuangporus sanghuang]